VLRSVDFALSHVRDQQLIAAEAVSIAATSAAAPL
jgi:hypothetical protein